MKKRIKKFKKLKKNSSSFLCEKSFHKAKIKVVGIGGGGCSIVSEIAGNRAFSKKNGVDFWAANTDIQALKRTGKKTKVFHFGMDEAAGLGCGMDFNLGEEAAQKKEEKIKKILQKADLCVLTASLGGGTGSGAAPVFAKISQNLKNINFGLFTFPFKFEGKKRAEIAKDSLLKLKPHLNGYAVFPNEKIFKVIDKKTSLKESFSKLNSVLAENLKSLIEVIFQPGMINIDWADLKEIFSGREKIIYLAAAQARGENRAEEAVKKVLNSPFCRHSMKSFSVEKILFNIAGSKNLTMAEVEEISETISEFNKKAKIIFGISQSPNLKNKIKITLLAVGRPAVEKPKKQKKEKQPVQLKKSVQVSEKKIIKRKKKKIKDSSVKNFKKKEKVKFVIDNLPADKKGDNSNGVKVRKNALQVKKEMEKAEKEILEKEKKWDIPAFLRQK